MKMLWLVFAWTGFTAATIFTLSMGANYFLHHGSAFQNIIGSKPIAVVAAANSADGQVKGVTSELAAGDARIDLVANFLRRHNSPLDPDEYSRKIVAIADRYDIDFRLLPAIAMQESNLCKQAPEGTHNCLGFGIHSRGTLGFDSYEEAFDRAGRELKKNYIDHGLTTPEEIMSKYTPSSNGSWAASVNQWMAEMRYDDRQKGRDLKTNADVLEFTQDGSVATVSAK